MPLGSTSHWAVVVPVGDRTNLISNSSFERGTAGWGTITGGTIGTTTDAQAFGAWSGSFAPTSNGTSGVVSPPFTLGNGSTYAVSAYIKGIVGIPYRIAVGDSAGVNFIGSTLFTGGGTMHRYSFNVAEPSGATRTFVLTKAGDSATGVVYIDGVQVELGGLTTYIDGDQEGCYWLGLPHKSQSVRSGTFRGGGSVIALTDLGLHPNDMLGVGMPPQDITMQSFAVVAGAAYQRSRSAERPFSITFKPIAGTTQQDYHLVRKAIENAFRPDTVSPQQPVRFWYTGGIGTVQIDAVYHSGLDLGQMHGPMAEDGAVKFIADDPYWYDTTQRGTALSPRVSLGSVNAIARRDPYGRWGTMGASGTGVLGTVDTILAAPTGTVFVGGRVNTFDGTANSRGIAMYYPQTNTFGSMSGTLTPGAIYNALALVYAPWGSLYVGGHFTTVNGTTTRHLAQWNGAWGTLNGGTVNDRVHTMTLSPSGTLILGGAWTTINGTTYPCLGQWSPAGSMGTLIGGTVDNTVFALSYGLDRQTLYLAGDLDLAGGTTCNNIAQWKAGTFGTLSTGLQWSAATPNGLALTVGLDGQVYAGGRFGTAGGIAGTTVARWSGIMFSAAGDGLGTSGANQVSSLTTDPATGDIYAAGWFNFSGPRRPIPDGMARFNGYCWLPLDLDINASTSNLDVVSAITFGLDHSIYVGGQWQGSAFCASVAEIVNGGMGEAYPVLQARNTGNGTARLYQLVNTLTGDGLYFDYALLAGESVMLTTGPGNCSLTSSAFGNVFGNILPGSNIAGFSLLPGTNYLSFFTDSDSVVTSIYWTQRSDSIDGGTVY